MINFPGKEKILFWQERKRLKQEIRRAILAAMTLAKNPKDRVVIEKFIDVIEPTPLYDIARLPYVDKPNYPTSAYSATKIHCVFALVSRLIQEYWTFIATEDTHLVTGCESIIDCLLFVCNNYDTLTVHGDLVKGYWLE